MRRRLALLVGATTSLVLAAFLIPLGLLLQQVAADRAVSEAIREAESVVPLVATLDRRTLASTLELRSAEELSRVPVTVFLPDGTALGDDVPRSRAVDLAQHGRSITAEAPGGREVLIAALGLPEGTAVVRAYVSDAQMGAGVARAWLILGLLGAGLLVLGLVVADRLARSTVKSLHDLDAVARRLGDGDLDARARPASVPELNEVGTTLNALAGRIRELLTRERESVADLSHRIRTPLTVLRIEAETLSSPDEAARLTSAADALQRAVDQAIVEARRGVTDRGSAPGGPACDAVSVVRDRVGFWQVLADEEARDVTTELPTTLLPVRLSTGDLAALVDALLGNVFAHTPEGTPFAVRLRGTSTGGAVLTVSDAGPGIPPDVVVLDRGASGGGSTGLGLDIVRRTAEASGGRITLGQSASGGVEVTVELGPPAPGRAAPPPPPPHSADHRGPDPGTPTPDQ
jgi:signal transduction histidine kinase